MSNIQELDRLSKSPEILPVGTTKEIEKVKMDLADAAVTGINIAFSGTAWGFVATGLVQLATGIATFSTLQDSLASVAVPLMASTMAGSFVAGLFVEKYSHTKSVIAELKSGYSLEGRVPAANAFPGLKEKRLPLMLTSPTGETEEVVLVSNRKGVWIEKFDRKPSLDIWDEMMESVQEVYNLPKYSLN